MKNIKSVMFFTLLLLASMTVMFGCAKEADLSETQPIEVPTETPTTQEEITGVEYEILSFEHLDAERQNAIEQLRQSEGYYVWEDERTLFIGMGLKPTGGFSIAVEKIEMLDGVLSVSVMTNTPAPDAMVTQALTTPFTVIQFQSPIDVDSIIVNSQEGKAYAELTLDLENQLVIEGTYVGQIDNNSIEVTVGESFMVFRNFLMSEIVMGFEEGDLVMFTYLETEDGQYQLIQMDPIIE